MNTPQFRATRHLVLVEQHGTETIALVDSTSVLRRRPGNWQPPAGDVKLGVRSAVVVYDADDRPVAIAETEEWAARWMIEAVA